MRKTLFIDTNIPMYAAGAEHPYKEPCVALLRAAAAGEVELVTDVEVFQEILHRYRAIGRAADSYRVYELLRKVVDHVYPVDIDAMDEAVRLLQSTPTLTSRDAIHAAIALRAQLDHIVSYDKHFDSLPSLRRLLPEQALA